MPRPRAGRKGQTGPRVATPRTPCSTAGFAASVAGPKAGMGDAGMLRFFLSLRYVMLVASIGASIGATLMFLEGGIDMMHATLAFATADDGSAVITAVMHGIDAFLFGIVLVIFAYAIAFGFVVDPSLPTWNRLPTWMRISSVSELKNTLVEVILLYLLVDFATDWPTSAAEPSWRILAKPVAILAIATAFGLFGLLHSLSRGAEGSEPASAAPRAAARAARRPGRAPRAG